VERTGSRVHAPGVGENIGEEPVDEGDEEQLIVEYAIKMSRLK
jgi:hypothetical protein